ncbi:trans-hexaprenyltranstransferase [Fructilactobacillus lindneri]|uniref:Trans-hexaprenyltranstransferase, component II n=2 Tax=Fructilactobacillus lindneri TaxID=53444 RepID=A0A0R2JQ48_9LACO|nr:polyprenyl synthetase family protein [Fructilactobacillus lindneri]ANZ58400.1 trans-hexaprenyltranstransferase [Fructilactobacillus lindneri]ANZ59721.1 trans-hexaprenyltranstransferase [Fructilactobacillus lindneri]KRN79241.1 trans-hexaprenyltranstransferase, component II [Fructilactobacillus lindneri DSM 20690 = JCM 11027]POG98496.1 trans-hexaprenyltranstransferase [Fructilactobacillus lindneri]POH03884.1 trans-hexaprenyltranstransferase [Fructilactobacillus lindneri]
MDLSLWENFTSLKEKLTETEIIMDNQIKVNIPEFNDGIKNLIDGNGKMLRSALLLLAANLGTKPDIDQQYEKAAASIEIIHLASLVHDDVIDESDLRRGKETLNFNFGIHNAVYLGDYLFTQYFELLLKYAPNFENLKYNVKVMEDLLAGELNQSVERYDVNRTENQYFKAIKGKTAELFRISMGEGAILSGGVQHQIALLEKIGLQIGMAFQIRDDLRDFEPDVETSKPTLNDVQSGIYTLPVIHALTTSYEEELEILLKKDQLNSADLEKVINIIEKSGGIDYARKVLQNFLDEAFSLLREIPDSSERTELEKVIHQLFS